MPKGSRKSKPKHKITKQAREAAKVVMKGNKFWEIRAKHGRDVLFGSPKLLWEAACEYFKWVDEHPWMKAENKVVSNGGGAGSSVELHEEPVRTPYSIHGLCLYLGCGLSYFTQFPNSKAYDNNKDFSIVIDNIKSVIYSQQFDGASSGFFNANIIARTLGLREQTDVTTAGQAIAAPVFKVFTSDNKIANDEKDIES